MQHGWGNVRFVFILLFASLSESIAKSVLNCSVASCVLFANKCMILQASCVLNAFPYVDFIFVCDHIMAC